MYTNQNYDQSNFESERLNVVIGNTIQTEEMFRHFSNYSIFVDRFSQKLIQLEI